MPGHRAHNKEKDEPCVASKLARRGAAQAKPGVYMCEHTAHSALGGTLQGVSRRSPGRSRLQELGRHGRTRQPEG